MHEDAPSLTFVAEPLSQEMQLPFNGVGAYRANGHFNNSAHMKRELKVISFKIRMEVKTK